MSDTFSLRSRDGMTHEYTIKLHPGDLGLPIAIELASGVLAPFARGIEQALSVPAVMERLQGIASDEGDATSVVDLLSDIVQSGKVDITKVALELQASLSNPDKIAVLAKKVLHFTVRDGKPLRDPKFFADAYRGNYAELFSAVWSVAAANGFLPLPAGSTTSDPPESQE